MKLIKLSIASIIAISSCSFAGGDIDPIIEPRIVIPKVPKTKEIKVPTYSSAGFYMALAYSYATEKQRTGITPNGIVTTADDATWKLSGMVSAGYQINDNFSIEGRLTNSMDDVTYNDIDVANYDLTNAALYAKVMYPMAITQENITSIYALLGYGQTTIDGSTTEYQSDGIQWGVGASHNINKNVSIFADYTQLALEDEYDTNSVTASHTDELDVSTINLGVAYKF
ncbi:putative outer membrane protein A [hydrothermal vent metagenome]|uniref:Putative outer membrane protein A n=1 Tax=hydrothermal vent metagenome TaxID=652676 RepID=A0A1W1ELI5_9ZZZZ